MSEQRTFEITYTKNGERKSFIVQKERLLEGDEWGLLAKRFNIPLRDGEPQTFKTLCIASGYTDVTITEQP